MKYISVLLLALALALPAAAQTSDPNVLKFRIGGFSTRDGMPSYRQLGLERKATAGADEWYIVQFIGTIQPGWLNQVRAKGGLVRDDYIPNNACLVKMAASTKAVVEKLSYVRFVGLYQPAFRIDPDLLGTQAAYQYDVQGYIGLMVVLFEGNDFKAVYNRMTAMAGIRMDKCGGDILQVSIPAGQATAAAKAIANYPEVYWVERYYQPVVNNCWTRWINQSLDSTGMGGSNSTWSAKLNISSHDDSLKLPIYAKGLYGQNQIVGVDDSGIDWDMIYFNGVGNKPPYDKDNDSTHGIMDTVCETVNLSRKVIAYNVYMDSSDLSYTSSGHGTHTTCTVAGDSSNLVTGKLGRAMGMAPQAKLAFSDHGKASSATGIYTPNNIGDIYRWLYNAGARITSSSWGAGAGAASSYNYGCYQIDKVAWTHKDLVMFRSAGNDNTSNDSCNTYAISKDIVCVGASESGFGDGATAWSATGTTSRNEIMDVAEFSSHGPSKEGERRPHLLVSGGWYIWSAQSDGNLTTGNAGVYYMGGTSMASPAAAGLCALERQYLTEGWYPSGTKTPADAIANPSGALLKAMMINSTRNSPGAYSISTINNTGTAPVPSQGQGWGRVVLNDVLYFSGENRNLKLVDETAGFASSGQSDVYTVVTSSASPKEPFKVVLVWTDYPSAVPVSQLLVNDLDLEVSDGTNTYKGSWFSGGYSQANAGTRDSLNCEEVVWIDSTTAASKTYTISVKSAAINQGPQPYALVVTGKFATNQAPLKPSQTRLFDCAQIPDKRPALSFSTSDPNGDNVTYRILYDTLATFAAKDSVTSGSFVSGAAGSYSFGSDLKNNHTYYWKVKASDPSSLWSPFSGIRSFTIDTATAASTCSWLQKQAPQYQANSLARMKVQGDSLVINPSARDTIYFNDFEADSGNFSIVDGNSQAADNWKWTNNPIPYGVGGPDGKKWWMSISGTYTNNEHLITPALNCAAAQACSLQWFGAHYFWSATADSFVVDTSSNNGSTWGRLQKWNTGQNTGQLSGPYSYYRMTTFDGKSQCKIRWRFYDVAGYGAGVDNVCLWGTNTSNTYGRVTLTPVVYADLNNTYARSDWGYIHCWKKAATDSVKLQVEYLNGGSWALIPDGSLPGNSAGICSTNVVVNDKLTGLNTTTYGTIRLVVSMYKGSGKSSSAPAIKAIEVGSTNPAPLAVSLSAMGAQVTDQGIVITWRTESEQDCYRWDIQRSRYPDHGYQQLGFLAGHGTTNAPVDYRYTDNAGLEAGTYYYRLIQTDVSGAQVEYGPAVAIFGGSDIPMAYALGQAVPNPVRNGTVIRYALRNAGLTSLKVYNVLGQQVKTLADGYQLPGRYNAPWDGRDDHNRTAASGIYFYNLVSGDYRCSKRMTVIK